MKPSYIPKCLSMFFQLGHYIFLAMLTLLAVPRTSSLQLLPKYRAANVDLKETCAPEGSWELMCPASQAPLYCQEHEDDAIALVYLA